MVLGVGVCVIICVGMIWAVGVCVVVGIVVISVTTAVSVFFVAQDAKRKLIRKKFLRSRLAPYLRY